MYHCSGQIGVDGEIDASHHALQASHTKLAPDNFCQSAYILRRI